MAPRITSLTTGLVNRPVQQFRNSVAHALDQRIGGTTAEERRDAIIATPGERLFAPDSPVRVVHADLSMLVGGLRALFLQSLHPLAMAGVANHSNYRDDPWGRLQRTADFLGVVTFGPKDWAEQSIAAVRRIHERVQGHAADGRPYSANDPHLLLWVHLAEVDSFLAAHRAFGRPLLSPAEQDRYVAEMALVAESLGADTPPRSVAELRAALAAFAPELRSTKAARDASRFLIVPVGLSAPERLGYAPLLSAAVSLLPLRARFMLRLPFLPVTERIVVRPVTSGVLDVGRWARPARPAPPTSG